jgi:phosphoserine phosphatase
MEKVNRLKELYPERETYHLMAYGDSRGDKELLDYADERNYKLFRQ